MANNIDLSYLSINQLLQNPTGSYSSYFVSRARIKENLDMRYYKLINKYKKFKFKIFEIKKDTYLYKFEIPSETYDNLFYDVLIQVENNDDKKATTVSNYDIKLFSNSPDFIFTYAYVLNSNNMIVDCVKNKINKKALTEPPTIKNPVETYGFEKSCYYACKYIKEHDLDKIIDIKRNVYIFDIKLLLGKIKSDEEKLAEYNKYKNKSKKKDKVNINTSIKKTIKKKVTNKVIPKKKIQNKKSKLKVKK